VTEARARVKRQDNCIAARPKLAAAHWNRWPHR